MQPFFEVEPMYIPGRIRTASQGLPKPEFDWHRTLVLTGSKFLFSSVIISIYLHFMIAIKDF